ncbi:MAG: HIT domain-containing protein [Cyanobacteria bacterium]|nr:HIT domain-containing protein [Cyanobacteriota bacterium]
MNTDCKLCAREFKSNYVIFEQDGWLIRHSEETNILGYFILQPIRHFLDLSEATAEESTGYGVILSALMKSIRKLTDCHRIYTFSLAEAVPHYHLHVIPKSQGFPRTYSGRGIMSYPTSPGASEELVETICERTGRLLTRQPSAGERTYSR